MTSTENKINIIAGCNRILNSTEELNKFIRKDYNAECGSGFYSIKDRDIAESYAIRAALNYGGKPYLNFFTLNIGKICNDGIKMAYFNELNEETMKYLSYNVVGKLPDHCYLNKYKNLRPVDVCMDCQYQNCNWNAEYIQAILLDCIYTNLTYIFIDYFNKKIDIEEASIKIYEELDAYTDNRFKFQIVLRNRILNLDNRYLVFDKAVPIIIK